VNATIGRWPSQDALTHVCASYLAELSPERQAAARARFNGSLSPGRRWVNGFLSRQQGLSRCRVGTLEKGRARNSRLNVVARWYALLTLLYRDHAITSARQMWNMDETHVHARTSAVEGCGGFIRGVGLRKYEVVLPSFASEAGACMAALCVSAAGVVVPHFVVVDGQASGHAFVTMTDRDCGKQGKALAAFLNDGAIVWHRSPPGFTK